MARQARRGRYVKVRFGRSRHGRQGVFRLGRARRRKAGFGRQGESRFVSFRQGGLRFVKLR